MRTSSFTIAIASSGAMRSFCQAFMAKALSNCAVGAFRLSAIGLAKSCGALGSREEYSCQMESSAGSGARSCALTCELMPKAPRRESPTAKLRQQIWCRIDVTAATHSEMRQWENVRYLHA